MELLGRKLGTHWADFGNVEPNPNRTMPWSGRRLLSTPQSNSGQTDSGSRSGRFAWPRVERLGNALMQALPTRRQPGFVRDIANQRVLEAEATTRRRDNEAGPACPVCTTCTISTQRLPAHL